MRQLLKAFGLSMALLGLHHGVQAQTYPGRPVTVIVPFAPGGGIDVLMRAMGPTR